MFHAFQAEKHWTSFPNEMEALFRYRYCEENLSLKFAENRLLSELSESFSWERLESLLRSRKYRQGAFPYEFYYESCVEDIEGSANYIEWGVLKQLDAHLADGLLIKMKTDLDQLSFYFPIRISGYYAGALLHMVAKRVGESFDKEKHLPIAEHLIAHSTPLALPQETGGMCDAVKEYIKETIEMIETAVRKNKIVLNERVELGAVNIYDARCLNGYLTSRHFIQINKNGQPETMYGNFVVKMASESSIEKIYSWD